METIEVKVKKYKTNDGIIYDTESEAIFHEKLKNGIIKIM